MRIGVFGSGGVGGYFGSCLARAGHDVVFIARGGHLDAMRTNGLQVESIGGDFHLDNIDATDDPAAVAPVDLVLVAVKAWQVPAAAAAMRPMLHADTLVLPLQNGVEAPSQLAAVLGKKPVLAGLCGVIAMIKAPGHIQHLGIEPFIKCGPPGNGDSSRLRSLCAELNEVPGMTIDCVQEIQIDTWRKFVFIAPWSGVGAASRVPIGVIRAQPETWELLRQAVEEVYRLALALEVPLPVECVPQTLDQYAALAADSTPSLQRDFMAGKPSELEAQTGAVVRLGRNAGVDAPVNAFLYSVLLPAELASRSLEGK